MPASKRFPSPSLPIERARLANGLRVVLSPDRSSPAVFVAAYYDVGLRSEPEDRTGFAHLFEHLMFEGSVSLEKGMHDKLVTSNGGSLNGSTWSDFTNYYEMLPSNALELALFLEADRMRGLRLTEENLRNQCDVVKEEIRLKIHNQPYARFVSVSVSEALFDTFPNAHDGWGAFADLEAATLDDVTSFFDRFYAPGNCVLVVSGDFEPAEAMTLIERHFGEIPARKVPPLADFSEPLPKKERVVRFDDPLAPQPAVALGYRIPDPMKSLPDYLAMVMLSSILVDGDASRLYLRLTKRDRIASHLFGGVGAMQGGPFDVRDPAMLKLVVFYSGNPDARRITSAIDEEVARIAAGIDEEEVERFRNSFLADYLSAADSLEDRAMTMAVLEQQRGRAEMINEIPAALAGVRAADVARVAGEWLVPDRRAVVDLHPGGSR
jgi:zinc protease